jgi:outer membrane protein
MMMGLTASAQKMGYLSYEGILKAMPEYAQVQTDMAQLRSQYEAEQKRVENDFNTKYEEFLDGQAAFPKTILQKRQSELQELMDRNIAFKKESLRLLAEAEQSQMAPLRQRLDEAIKEVGTENGYFLIVNTDANATPWLNTDWADNVTEAVMEKLKK